MINDWLFIFVFFKTISEVEEVCISKQSQSRDIPLSVYLNRDVLAHFKDFPVLPLDTADSTTLVFPHPRTKNSWYPSMSVATEISVTLYEKCTWDVLIE